MKIIWVVVESFLRWHLPFVWTLLPLCADLSVEHSEALHLHLNVYITVFNIQSRYIHKVRMKERERKKKKKYWINIKAQHTIQAECKVTKILTKSIKLQWRYRCVLFLFIFLSSPKRVREKIQFKAWKHFSVHTLTFNLFLILSRDLYFH